MSNRAVKEYNDAHDDEKLKVSLGNFFFFYFTIYFLLNNTLYVRVSLLFKFVTLTYTSDPKAIDNY